MSELYSPALKAYIVIGSVLIGIYGAFLWHDIRKVWKEGK